VERGRRGDRETKRQRDEETKRQRDKVIARPARLQDCKTARHAGPADRFTKKQLKN
jgi:hypothetical protein